MLDWRLISPSLFFLSCSSADFNTQHNKSNHTAKGSFPGSTFFCWITKWAPGMHGTVLVSVFPRQLSFSSQSKEREGILLKTSKNQITCWQIRVILVYLNFSSTSLNSKGCRSALLSFLQSHLKQWQGSTTLNSISSVCAANPSPSLKNVNFHPLRLCVLKVHLFSCHSDTVEFLKSGSLHKKCLLVM